MDAALKTARVSFAEFAALAYVRRHLHRVAFALDFNRRIGRPVDRALLARLIKKTIGVELSPTALGVLFALCGDGGGHLDSVAFVKLLRRRERMPGRGAGGAIGDAGGGAGGAGGDDAGGPVSRFLGCFKRCMWDSDGARTDAPE